MIQQSKINGFIKSITDVAEEKKAKIDAETNGILAREKKRLEKEAKRASQEYYRAKSARVKLEAGRRISDASAQCRKTVFERRNGIEREVFSCVEEKLAEFTKGGEYEAFLLKSARRIAAEFDGDAVIFLLRGEDMKFADAICKQVGGASVREEDSIRIGGLKAYSENCQMRIDDTLDSRLKQQTRWFEENSGLYIDMG